jgi:imidazolonepropionase-like amidohydrolase
VARANGVTSVAIVPSGGLVGGQIAVMNLDGWTWEEATVKASAGLSLQFPPVVRAGGFGGPSPDAARKYADLKKERDARLDAFIDQVTSARAYAVTPAAERRTDWTLESLVPVATGQVPLFVLANAEALIRDAVAFADRAGVKLVIMGGLEAPLAAALLRERQVPVILGSVLTTPLRDDAHHAATYRAAADLAAAGVTFAFGSGGYANVRLIPYEAAISVAWGLPRDRAVQALTIDAARILGVSDRLGSLEVGKAANLFVAAGDPLDVRTAITHVVVGGRDVGLDNKHFAMFQRFSARPMRGKP